MYIESLLQESGRLRIESPSTFDLCSPCSQVAVIVKSWDLLAQIYNASQVIAQDVKLELAKLV